MRKKVELLAPAGSFDVMKACIAAGADAVYMGMSRFSARAYADNAGTEDYIQAIDYAHLHGKKLYLTVNTLFKEQELLQELGPMLVPLYEAGLDGVIVQDIGAMRLIRERFPDLPLHVSTQAVVSGPESAAFYKRMGAVRVVPARELSLAEIRAIYEKTGMEIECFVHGALCYCYSGQCLFSSIAGGRSGNRGRCAQPCRMAYEVTEGNEKRTDKKHGYVLSLKDLNTLKLLPEIIEAGVCSLKIEGRMKKAEYAAGVTSIYRKYLDLYEKNGKNGYKTDPADEKKLFDLFNRNGFSDGYYKKQNGKEMLTLKEAAFREENEALDEFIREHYIRKEHAVPVTGFYEFRNGCPYVLTLTVELDGREFTSYVCSEEAAERSKNRAADRASVEKQLNKTGGTGFYFKELDGVLEDGLFLPVSRLNEFRRQAFQKLTEEILAAYRRKAEETDEDTRNTADAAEKEVSPSSFTLSALVRTKEQCEAVLRSDAVSILHLESTAYEAAEYGKIVERAHRAGKKITLALPQVYRARSSGWFEKERDTITQAGFDGVLVRSLDALKDAESIGGIQISDHQLYAFNSKACAELENSGFLRTTVPVELNRREIRETGVNGREMILYGRLPMMVTANCLNRTTGQCDHRPHLLTLKDRMGNEMPVTNDCRNCMNTIWNSLPVDLLDEKESIRELGLAVGRLEFTVENAWETEEVLRRFSDVCLHGAPAGKPRGEFTRGHFRRGVE